MKLTERESRLITLLALVVIVAFGLRYLVLPAYSGWQLSREALHQSRLSDWQSGGQNSSGSQGGENAEEFAYSFIPAAQPESLHYYFSGLAEENRLTLNNIDISENEKILPGRFTRMDVSLSLTGTQADIIGFLKGFDERGAAIAAESFAIRPDGDQVSLEAVFHVYCEEKENAQGFGGLPATPAPADGFRFAAENGVR